jgi:hypothetical protein
MQVLWDKNEECHLRNEASLNFVSLRSHVDSVGRRGPSRIKMNALRAPLTALYVSNGREIVFSVDSADAFIDRRLFVRNGEFETFTHPRGTRDAGKPPDAFTSLPE